jgi:hypothetical protein
MHSLASAKSLPLAKEGDYQGTGGLQCPVSHEYYEVYVEPTVQSQKARTR